MMKRAANFTQAEEELLMDLVHMRKNILECKKTDSVTNKAKAEAWKALAAQFNSNNPVYRDASILKRKYDNFKKISKKRLKNCEGTGKEPHVEIDPVDETKEFSDSQITKTEYIFDYDVDIEDCTMHDNDQLTEGNLNMECNSSVNDGRSALEVHKESSNYSLELNSPSTSDNHQQTVIEENETDTVPEVKPIFRKQGVKKTSTEARISREIQEAKLELIRLQIANMKAEMRHKEEEHQLRMKLMQKEHDELQALTDFSHNFNNIWQRYIYRTK